MVWAATGIAVAGALYGGVMASKSAEAAAGQSRVASMSAISEAALNDEMAKLQADDTMDQAQKQAAMIKKQAQFQRGGIIVAQSGSGAVIGEGSAMAALDQLETLSSADALAALYSGINESTSTRASGRFQKQAGTNRASTLGAQAASQSAAGQGALIGGVLSAAGAAAGGYVKSTTATTTIKKA